MPREPLPPDIDENQLRDALRICRTTLTLCAAIELVPALNSGDLAKMIGEIKRGLEVALGKLDASGVLEHLETDADAS